MTEFNLSYSIEDGNIYEDSLEVIPVKEVKEFIKILKEFPYNREDYIEQWQEHFILLNKRKPTKRELMCFKVGFAGGTNMFEQRIDKHSGYELK